MTYEYTAIVYDQTRELMDQINAVCEKKPNIRFHSMGQRYSKINDLRTGQPKVDIMLIFEIGHTDFPKPEAEA